MAVNLIRALATLVLLPALAQAQTAATLADPTKPAPAYLPGGVADAAGVAAAPLSRLTSVKLPHRGGAPSAIVDGQLVRLGEMVGEAKLIRISETAVVLDGPQGRETLYMIPDVTKTPAVTRATHRPSAKEKR